MKNRTTLIVGLIILSCFISCKLFEKEEPKPIEVYGCMDSLATNYNTDATIDNDTCEYDIFGCMDSTATNYNPDATIDDGSCDYCEEGSAFILLSTDGGNTWDINCLKERVGSISDISVIDSNNIWLCTYPNDYVPNAQILYTSNGGMTWEEQYSFDNSGLTWEEINFNGTGKVVKFFNEDVGIVAEWNGDIQKTNDGGNTWEIIDIPLIDYGHGDIEFHPENSNEIWSLTDYGLIFSDDGGNAWEYKCENHEQYGGQAISITDSKVMLFSSEFFIGNQNNCDPFENIILPESTNGLSYSLVSYGDFDNIGNDIIVIPGFISN